jgi:hypothetical protein
VTLFGALPIYAQARVAPTPVRVDRVPESARAGAALVLILPGSRHDPSYHDAAGWTPPSTPSSHASVPGDAQVGVTDKKKETRTAAVVAIRTRLSLVVLGRGLGESLPV